MIDINAVNMSAKDPSIDVNAKMLKALINRTIQEDHREWEYKSLMAYNNFDLGTIPLEEFDFDTLSFDSLILLTFEAMLPEVKYHTILYCSRVNPTIAGGFTFELSDPSWTIITSVLFLPEETAKRCENACVNVTLVKVPDEKGNYANCKIGVIEVSPV